MPPDIIDKETSKDTTVKEGQDVTLSCIASGHPKPNIKWIREDGKPFSVVERRQNNTRIQTGMKRIRLHIIHV